jgi:enamine deaminase RidA (YjgF/YER057c/UK114 family)
MSGYPAIGPDGIIGKGDMRVQTLQALDYVKRTVEAAGASWDDIVHMTFFFTDREKWHREAIPARITFFEKHSTTGELPCITSIGVTSLMHPDMLIEIEATAVWE